MRDLLVARPGRRYSEDELIQSQRNLYDSDLFRYATVNIDSAAYQARGRDSVPLLVQVNESQPPPDPGGLGYAHRGLLPRLARLDHPQLSRGQRPHPRSHRPDLQGRRRRPIRLGPRKQHLQRLAGRPSALSSSTTRSERTVRRPAFLSSNNTLAGVGVQRAALGVPGVPATRDRHHGDAEPADASAADSRSRCRIICPTDAPRRATRASAPRSTPVPRTWWTCSGRTGCSRTLTGNGSLPRINNPIDPSRGSVKSLEVTVSSHLLGSAEFQQFTRVVGDASWYRQLSRDVVFSWRVRGGLDLLARGGGRHPARQLHPARAAILRRRPQRRPRLRPQRARPGGLRRFQAEVDDGVPRRPINPGLGHGRRHRRQHPRASATSSSACPRRCSGRGSGSRPSSTSGGAWQRGGRDAPTR